MELETLVEDHVMSYPSADPAPSKDESLSLPETAQPRANELRRGLSTGSALGLNVIETSTHSFEEADLNSAHRVIGVGRGLKAKEDLAMIGELA